MFDVKRREFISLLGGVAVVWPLATRAQQAKVYRIGVLEVVSPALNAPRLEALRQGLRERGYIEGRNYCSNIARPMATMNAFLTWRPSSCDSM